MQSVLAKEKELIESNRTNSTLHNLKQEGVKMLIKQIKDGDRIVSETYKFRNATVEVVAPPPMSEEEIEKVLDDMHKVGWEIIKDLVAKGKEV